MVEQVLGLGGGGAGTEGDEALVGDPQDGPGVGPAQLGQAAALAEEGLDVLEDLAEALQPAAASV